MAVYSLGMKPGQSREWARRRGVKPAEWKPNPSRGQALALWDLADVNAAVRQQSAACATGNAIPDLGAVHLMCSIGVGAEDADPHCPALLVAAE